MLRKSLILFSVLFILIQCDNPKKTEKKTVVMKSDMNEVHQYPHTDSDSLFAEKIRDWTEYFDVKDFLKQYEKTSATEALNNALELKQLVKKAKDSNTIAMLNTSEFRARINVFENEVLRLADMTYIPAIKSKEVHEQIQKIFNTFHSLNSKINSVYDKEKLDKSIKMDSIFKNMQ